MYLPVLRCCDLSWVTAKKKKNSTTEKHRPTLLHGHCAIKESLNECVRDFVCQKNDSWDCGSQGKTTSSLYLNDCGWPDTRMAATANAVSTLELGCLSQKVPTPLCLGPFPRNYLVSVWVLHLCHRAAVASHSSQISSWLRRMLKTETKGRTEANRAEWRAENSSNCKQRGGQERVAHCEITILPDVMEILQASVVHVNFELKVL